MQAFSTLSANCLLVCLVLLKTVSSTGFDFYYCSINAERVKAGVAPLLVDSRIETAAASHANYLASKNLELSYVSNITNCSNPGVRLDNAGYSWACMAELQSNINPPINFWLNDPDRRATLLNPQFKSFGFGLGRNSTGYPYYVLDLATADDYAAKGKAPNCEASNNSTKSKPFDYISSINGYLELKNRTKLNEDSILKGAARIRANELINFYSSAGFLSAFDTTETLLTAGYPIGSYYSTENCYIKSDAARVLLRIYQRTDTMPDDLLCNSGYFTAEGVDNVYCTVVIFAKSKTPKLGRNRPANYNATVNGTKPVTPPVTYPAPKPTTPVPATKPATPAPVADAAKPATSVPATKPATPAPAVPATKPATPAPAVDASKPATPAPVADAAKPATPAPAVDASKATTPAPSGGSAVSTPEAKGAKSAEVRGY